MGPNSYILILIILVNTLTGFIIKAANPTRSQNRRLFMLSTSLTAWMICVLGIINAHSEEHANFLIRAASMIATALPLNLQILLQTILSPSSSLKTLLHKTRHQAISCALIMLLCWTGFFMSGVTMPSLGQTAVTVPDANYNFGFIIFAAYMIISLGFSMYAATRAMLRAAGLVRIELQYVLVGVGASLSVGFFISLIIPLLTQSTQVQQYGPTGVIAMIISIAYGIATKRVLDVGTLIRRAVAYLLLTGYLVIIYLASWLLCRHLIFRLTPYPDFLSQLAAAITVAFSMSPAHGRLRRVANKLIASQTMDVPTTMKKAGQIFHSVTTINALIQQFSSLLVSSLGAIDVRVLIAHNNSFHEEYSNGNMVLGQDSHIAKVIRNTKEPVCCDTLDRSRQTEEIISVGKEMKNMNTRLATGFFSKDHLRGIVLLEERLDGKIYSQIEQETVQILCNQFAVALENAYLYTEMQDSKIRNDILLDELPNGVILASPDHRLLMINHEAQRITKLTNIKVQGKNIALLPLPIYEILKKTIKNESGVRNVEAALDWPEEEKKVNVRMGTTFLYGHDQKPMGALLVFTDLTELKALEEQVRRSSQLSSVGTLAAGMAHEIKNPLVTIKTFTQLLPERYTEPDFREDFSSLVAHEVKRIDDIVNQLLSFSKPTKPILDSMNLHDTIGGTLKLINEQLAQNNIELNTNLQAKTDLIYGDDKLLSQVLVNLCLNAIEAIGSNGNIHVETTNCKYRFADARNQGKPTTHKCIRFAITDNGPGISPKNLQKIFDPFYTDKSEGTGMGLSISHGIIEEHGSVIEVESELDKGTTFSIYFPLHSKEALIV